MRRRSRSPGTTRRAPGRLLAALCLALVGAAPLPAPVRAQAPRTVTLEAPVAGAAITDPVEVRGRVTVAPFENNLVGTVSDAAGQALGQGPVPVTPDDPATLGGPGSFSAALRFTAGAGGAGRVAVADVSQADGSVLASASVDVVLPSGVPPPPAATSWLDQPLAGAGWNVPGGAVPAAPPFQGNADPRCAAAERPAETPEDQQVVAAGWRLFREYQGGWDSRLLFGLSGYDGMCRPLGFQAFVFRRGGSPGRAPAPARGSPAPPRSGSPFQARARWRPASRARAWSARPAHWRPRAPR